MPVYALEVAGGQRVPLLGMSVHGGVEQVVAQYIRDRDRFTGASGPTVFTR
jgi:hypothetical protein